jgi:hypothetical protein
MKKPTPQLIRSSMATTKLDLAAALAFGLK